ncbi:MAG: NfeD family protein [Clostridia bacterium]|nr:NfeD family protein [Clostridia bacterium]MBQ2252133.1 NfeD family protein [Clostridia bacterium]MBQ5601730.1 NfeD family protein [Clostridia bacterium]
MTLMLYIWIGIIIAALIVEALTAGLTSIWFIPAAIVGIILELFKVPQAIQITAFLVMSLVGVLFLRKFSKKSTHVATNVTDMVIGGEAIVTERIDSLAETGEVKIDGKRWSARLENGGTAEIGDHVEVIRIVGVKLICKKL